MTMNSTTHTAGQDFLASHYNDLRNDSMIMGGEYVVATGSSNAFVATIDSQITSYTTGMKVCFKANHTITWAATINVNALWAKSIINKWGYWIISRDIISGAIYELRYNGTSFVLLTDIIDQFGDGSDWDVTISSNTTLTRDMYYNNLTVNTAITLDPAWYAIYVKWTLTLTGTAKIIRNGNNASGQIWGTALATWTCWPNLWGSNGANSVNGAVGIAWTNGTAVSTSYATTATASVSWWGGWSAWVAWSTWWTSATATQWTLYNTIYRIDRLFAYLQSPSRAQINTTQYGALPSSGSGGSGGAWTWSNSWVWGGAWWNGGIIFVYARILAWSGTIESKWWNGGTWWNGTGAIQPAWGGGGGWGGCGWIVVLVYNTWTPYTITLTWGTAGTFWTWINWGNSWTAWTAWTVWQSILIQV